MRIVIVTQEEPFYLPPFLERLAESRPCLSIHILVQGTKEFLAFHGLISING